MTARVYVNLLEGNCYNHMISIGYEYIQNPEVIPTSPTSMPKIRKDTWKLAGKHTRYTMLLFGICLRAAWTSKTSINMCFLIVSSMDMDYIVSIRHWFLQFTLNSYIPRKLPRNPVKSRGGGILFGGQRLHGGVDITRGARYWPMWRHVAGNTELKHDSWHRLKVMAPSYHLSTSYFRHQTTPNRITHGFFKRILFFNVDCCRFMWFHVGSTWLAGECPIYQMIIQYFPIRTAVIYQLAMWNYQRVRLVLAKLIHRKVTVDARYIGVCPWWFALTWPAK